MFSLPVQTIQDNQISIRSIAYFQDGARGYYVEIREVGSDKPIVLKVLLSRTNQPELTELVEE